ncbi:MAG: hypothetical protein IPL12_04980 [Bacteroidetes bacterium]|nr:hypothetical protein [Bacteroidota bacterium]MBK8342729.1 hypothetical protein [Bacteroidota bacterium]
MGFINIENFESQYSGKSLTDIKYFTVNESITLLDANYLAIIDGGIELDFEGSKLVIAWNVDIELFDTANTSINEVFGDLEFYQIDSNSLPLGKSLLGRKLIGLKPKWEWFNNLDDELEPTGPKQYFLIELILFFEDQQSLQLATINYDLEKNEMKQASYDTVGELLIALNQILDITATN